MLREGDILKFRDYNGVDFIREIFANISYCRISKIVKQEYVTWNQGQKITQTETYFLINGFYFNEFEDHPYYIWHHFYTIKELRLQKLQKLNGTKSR